jgi:hypothetical protein
MAGASSNTNVIEPEVSTPSRRKLLRIAAAMSVVTSVVGNRHHSPCAARPRGPRDRSRQHCPGS